MDVYRLGLIGAHFSPGFLADWLHTETCTDQIEKASANILIICNPLTLAEASTTDRSTSTCMQEPTPYINWLRHLICFACQSFAARSRLRRWVIKPIGDWWRELVTCFSCEDSKFWKILIYTVAFYVELFFKSNCRYEN